MKILIVTDNEYYGGVAAASTTLQKYLTSPGVEVERHPIHTVHRGVFGRLYSILKTAFYLRSCVADKIVLMHFEAIFAGILCQLFRPNLGFVNCIHTDLHGYYCGVSSVKKIFLRFVIKKLKNKTVIFVSKEAESKARIKFGFTNARVIYNFVDLPQKRATACDKQALKLGSVSRLHSGKNIDLLIRVFNSFWLVNTSVKLLIFGDGPELINIKKYAAKFPCVDSVEFKGHVAETDEIYEQIDGLVSFSSIEGFPLVILEALARNIPVLHSDCSCGPREILVSNSDPCWKTSSFEIGQGGMLVKIPERIKSYAPCLQQSEKVILKAFCTFCQNVDFFKINCVVDMEKFGPDIIRKKWIDLLLK